MSEQRLISGIEPIRDFVLAQALFHFMDSGVQEFVGVSGSATINAVAEEMRLDEERLRGFLQYLANEGYVRMKEGETVSLTAKGEELADFRPWYTLIVGGYALTFLQLQEVLRAERPYAERNSAHVGVGSCGISQFDALPMTRQLIKTAGVGFRTVVDLGCGDGSYLIDLCQSMPELRGVGLDPDPISVAAGARSAEDKGMADRVDIRLGSAEALPELELSTEPLCFVTAFVLQEILEQSGRAAVLSMLSATFDRYPGARWIVIEVDYRPSDSVLRSHGLGLAYYNPYYLIHQLTQQRLETVPYWERLFSEADLQVLATEYPDASYDSLRLKVGFLLGRSQ